MEKNNRIFEKHIELDSPEEALSLLGACSCHGDLVERALSVDCETTAEGMVIRGPVRKKVEAAAQIFDRLHELCRDGTPVTEQLVRYLLDAALADTFSEAELFTPDLICVNAKGKPVLSKTAGQKKYIEAIRKHDLTFAIGPAGTGKTYLSVAMAVKAFRDHDVSRIILTRPAVEAGEN